ncbi:hypothetical protein BsWGS_15805 [Bradybaena similaris]
MPFADCMKPINAPWISTTMQRTQKPLYNSLRRFDPITKREVQTCGDNFQSLVHLCRRVILKAIPLTEMENAPSQLPLPSILANTVCRLRLDDFFINPMKVQTRDILTGCYNTVESFNGQEVVLEVLPGGARGKDFRRRPEYMTSFNDRGVLCIVWDPVRSLEEFIRATARVGHYLSHHFVWQVIEAVSLFISTHCKAYDWHINPSIVKLAKNRGTIYVDNTTAWAKSNHTSLNMNHAPEILAGGRFVPEKAFVWALGSLIYEMMTLTPLVYDTSLQQQINPALPFKGLSKRGPAVRENFTKVMPTREAYDRLINNLSLRHLIQDCLNEDPLLRPTIKSIIGIAQNELAAFACLNKK